ncbi:MAG TPA: NfeD family protein [Alphaproteobacteria bacterium]|nr:NfeD family protein [Alphaproteobacteria bacterium]
MIEFFKHLEFWHWWIFAFVLAIMEIIVPGAFFIWFGLSSLVTGLVLLAIPSLGWEWQLVFWVVLGLAIVIGWRLWVRAHPNQSEDNNSLNRRGQQYMGRVLELDEPIINGQGKAKLGDTVWRVSGPELGRGHKVKVVGTNGTILVVEKYQG